ncbi:MAG TPA: hypothetical protein VFU86_14695 [Terriglobales bacterium]|nr:hypothetical protein [Terriglobales bacterium]
MKKFWIGFIAIAGLSCTAWGQKVEVEKPERGEIIHVQTALDHLTVLEMSGPVRAVAVGSSSFHVEWRENKVFIEPTEPDVATNLFVWTPSGRFNYELDPAGAVPQMVFAIDQPVPNPPKIKIAQVETARPADPPPDEVLMEMTPVQFLGRISGKNRVSVRITDLFEQNDQILIRYSIRNDTNHPYLSGTPQVVGLKDARYRQSLYTLRDYQLSEKESAQVKSTGGTLVRATFAQIPALPINPGETATRIVTIDWPSSHPEPTVLELNFPRGPDGPVRATLVL